MSSCYSSQSKDGFQLMDNNGIKKRLKSSSSSSMVGCDDRISKLPDSMIFHILSFLPTEEMVRTCLLSKRWKLIWYSVPTLFFSNTTADEIGLEKFWNYVENFLEHRKKGTYFMGDSDVTSFKLMIKSGFFRRIKAGLLDKWLGFAVENKVKEMYLSIGQENFEESNSYCLPKILDNARYLTILELDRVKLDSSHSFTFPYLKTLSLERIHQSDTSKDDVVFKFLLGCSCLEKLRLHRYKFLNIDGKLPLQSLSLKFLEVKDSANVDGLKVEAINLESLVITGTSVYNMIHSACKKIRNLSLDDTSYDFELLLRTLIDNNPLLENLTLSTCYTYDFLFKISGEHLKSFNFKNRCLFESKITIESTPKLAYFCYEGTIDLSLSIEPSNSLSGKIVIHEGGHYVFCGYDAAWFTDMLNFLLNLNCSWNIVSLHASRCQALIWPENLKRVCRSPLLNWKHLRVITKDSDPERISDLKDSMMWISPSLETLSINKMQIF